MKLLFSLARESWLPLLFGVLAGMATGACTPLLLAFTANAVDEPAFSPTSMMQYLGLIAATVVLRIVASLLLTALHQQVIARLRVQIATQIGRAPFPQIEARGAHRLWLSLTEDVHTVSDAVGAIPWFVVNASALVGSLVYLYTLSPRLTALSVVVLAVAGGGFHFVIAKMWAVHSKAQEAHETLFRHLRSVVDGVKELQLNSGRRNRFLSEVLTPSADSLKRANARVLVLYDTAASISRSFYLLLVGALLFVVPAVLPMDRSALVGFVLTIMLLQAPIEGLLNMFPMFGRAAAVLPRLRELGLGSSDLEGGTPLPSDWKEIELRDVVHSYRSPDDDRSFTLGPINLRVRRGEILILVGGNGSGKTTLSKVLTGLYEAGEGAVLVDGSRVQAGQYASYRAFFSAVFADFHLFESLLEPPTEGQQARVTSYLRRLLLDRKVRLEQGRWSTVALSQGQRKRLALLSAWMEDRPAVVFDEWAADQDPEFKAVFYRELLPELRAQGKAVVVISHDEHYFDCADRIVRLEAGSAQELSSPWPRAIAGGS